MNFHAFLINTPKFCFNFRAKSNNPQENLQILIEFGLLQFLFIVLCLELFLKVSISFHVLHSDQSIGFLCVSFLLLCDKTKWTNMFCSCWLVKREHNWLLWGRTEDCRGKLRDVESKSKNKSRRRRSRSDCEGNYCCCNRFSDRKKIRVQQQDLAIQ